MYYRNAHSVGAHQCPLCLSFGVHEPGCPEIQEEYEPEPEPEPERTCRECGLPLTAEEVTYCSDHACGGYD